MKIQKAFKYRLRPNRQQLTLFAQFSGCCRFVYNRGLARREEAYKQESPLRYYDQNKELTVWRKDFPWLAQCHSQVLQQSLKDLDRAYTNFFRRVKNREKPGFPKFKKRGMKDGFRFPQGFKVEKQRVYLPKIGWVRFRKSREIMGHIKEATVVREADRWFVSFSVEYEKAIESFPLNEEQVIGIDLGCQQFATLAIGLKNEQEIIEHPKHLINLLGKLRRYSKDLSRKQFKSKNYHKFRKKLARLHLRIKDARADFLHKHSTRLIKNHDLICVEMLHVQEMLEKAHRALARKIADSGWRKFLSFLEYKAVEWGKRFQQIGAYYPSSQLCSHCHNQQKLKLSDRVFRCSSCGLELDRDLNAAINIKAAGTTAFKPVELAPASAEAGISRL